jgi:uncharacterized protein YbcC (UPF0753/DUF2309 family)
VLWLIRNIYKCYMYTCITLTYSINWHKEVHMNKRNKHLTTTLQHMGQTLGLTDNDIASAKRTACSMLGITIAAAVVILIGKIVTSQLDAVGLYYTGVSIKDFGLLSRFF